MLQTMAVQVSSQEDSWITPIDIITQVKEVMGSIELDPASSEVANKVVGAVKIFTRSDDSLTLNWKSKNFFLNPPYGKVGNKSQAGIFAEYAISQYKQGNITEGGIILLHDRGGYDWFENLFDKCSAAATLRKRVRFINPHTMKQGDQAKTAQTLFCVGDTYKDRFIEIFQNNSRIYVSKT